MMKGASGDGGAARSSAYEDPNAMMRALHADGLSNLPIPELGNPDEVRKEALARSMNVFKSYDILRNVLDRHEATIQKRWLKKGKEQRRKLIVEAWGRKVCYIFQSVMLTNRISIPSILWLMSSLDGCKSSAGLPGFQKRGIDTARYNKVSRLIHVAIHQ